MKIVNRDLSIVGFVDSEANATWNTSGDERDVVRLDLRSSSVVWRYGTYIIILNRGSPAVILLYRGNVDRFTRNSDGYVRGEQEDSAPPTFRVTGRAVFVIYHFMRARWFRKLWKRSNGPRSIRTVFAHKLLLLLLLSPLSASARRKTPFLERNVFRPIEFIEHWIVERPKTNRFFFLVVHLSLYHASGHWFGTGTWDLLVYS